MIRTVALRDHPFINVGHQFLLHPLKLLKVIEELIHTVRAETTEMERFLVFTNFGNNLWVALFEARNPVLPKRLRITVLLENRFSHSLHNRGSRWISELFLMQNPLGNQLPLVLRKSLRGLNLSFQQLLFVEPVVAPV